MLVVGPCIFVVTMASTTTRRWGKVLAGENTVQVFLRYFKSLFQYINLVLKIFDGVVLPYDFCMGIIKFNG